MTVTVLVPVYNETRSIATVLRKVVEKAPSAEVIVIDDGSTDGTSEILQRLNQELPFRLLRHAHNCGKGAALRTGLREARGEAVLIQDADLEYDPVDYPKLLEPLRDGRSAVIYGSRFLDPRRSTSRWHRFGNWLVTAAVNLLFRSSLTDVETCYKVFRRDVLGAIPLRARGFEFEVEVTCKLLRRRQAIVEIPVSYYGRSYAEGKKITWRDGVMALWVIVACRVNPWY